MWRIGRALQSRSFNFDGEPTPSGWTAGQSGRTYDTRGRVMSVDETKHTWSYSGGYLGYSTATEVTRYRSVAKSYWDASGQPRVQQINRDSVDYRSAPTLYYGQPWGVYGE